MGRGWGLSPSPMYHGGRQGTSAPGWLSFLISLLLPQCEKIEALPLGTAEAESVVSLAERLSWQGRRSRRGLLGTNCSPFSPLSASTWLSRPRATPESGGGGGWGLEGGATGLGLSLSPAAPLFPGLFTEPSPRGNFKPPES